MSTSVSEIASWKALYCARLAATVACSEGKAESPKELGVVILSMLCESRMDEETRVQILYDMTWDIEPTSHYLGKVHASERSLPVTRAIFGT